MLGLACRIPRRRPGRRPSGRSTPRRCARTIGRMIHEDILLLVLPESGAALLVWPDGRAIRIERDGSVTGCIDRLPARRYSPRRKPERAARGRLRGPRGVHIYDCTRHPSRVNRCGSRRLSYHPNRRARPRDRMAAISKPNAVSAKVAGSDTCPSPLPLPSASRTDTTKPAPFL